MTEQQKDYKNRTIDMIKKFYLKLTHFFISGPSKGSGKNSLSQHTVKKNSYSLFSNTLQRSVILAAVVLAYSGTAQGAKHEPGTLNAKEPLSSQHTFSMAAPKGWQCISDKAQLPAKVQMVYIGTGKGQFTPSINLATEETSLGLEEYVKVARSYHESQGETSCHSLGSLQTPAGKAIVIQIDRNTQWGPVRFVQAALINNGNAYVITATCLLEDFNAFAAQFFKAIQTFTINNV